MLEEELHDAPPAGLTTTVGHGLMCLMIWNKSRTPAQYIRNRCPLDDMEAVSAATRFSGFEHLRYRQRYGKEYLEVS